MKSSEEMRLAIIEQFSRALVELNDDGSWNPQERMEAADVAEEYATVIINMLNIEITEFSDKKFVLAGELADVEPFIKKYLNEPLVRDVNE